MTQLTHISKEEALTIQVGDVFYIRQDLVNGHRYDGNTFSSRMQTEGEIHAISLYESYGVTAKDENDNSWGYTYDMIRQVYRNGKLIFGEGSRPTLFSHESFVKAMEELGVEVTDEMVKYSKDCITFEEFKDIEVGDKIILKVNMNDGRKYGQLYYYNSMSQFHSVKKNLKSLVVLESYVDKEYVNVEIDLGNSEVYSRQMIEKVIKKNGISA